MGRPKGSRNLNPKHGESWSGGATTRTPEYVAWINMLGRCTSPNYTGFALYGGRGIRVCERWLTSYSAFLADMGRRPTPAHSLDRVDADGNYEPGNCRWATESQQQRNRRNNRMITAFGQTKCLAEWSESTGIKRETIAVRIKSGHAPERALDPTPLRPGPRARKAA